MLYLSFVKQGDISYSNYKHQYNKIHQTDRRTDWQTIYSRRNMAQNSTLNTQWSTNYKNNNKQKKSYKLATTNITILHKYTQLYYLLKEHTHEKTYAKTYLLYSDIGISRTRQDSVFEERKKRVNKQNTNSLILRNKNIVK